MLVGLQKNEHEATKVEITGLQDFGNEECGWTHHVCSS